MPVYLGARDLSGMPVGTHQFIVIISSILLTPHDIGFRKVRARSLGSDKKGVVVGAQNRGRLVVEFFNEADFKAAKEHFGGREVNWYKPDFDVHMVKVNFDQSSDLITVKRVLERLNAYLINQKTDPIKYPTAGFGFNSNSWVQSLIQYAGGEVEQDMPGFDVAHDKRLPRTYFEPVCPLVPRPKINEG